MGALTWRALVLAVALSGACGAAFPAEQVGTVTHVSDGDTVYLRVGRSRPFPVRLQGLDAPERCQDGGPEAAAALASRVLRREVTVSTVAEDAYGRQVGTLRLDGEDIGRWLVAEGHAWNAGHRHARGPYAEEERRARNRHLGVFAGPAVEPAVFRRSHGPCPRPTRRAQPATSR